MKEQLAHTPSPLPARQRSKSTTPSSEASNSSTPLLSRELVDKLARCTFAAEDTFEMSRYDEAMDRDYLRGLATYT